MFEYREALITEMYEKEKKKWREKEKEKGRSEKAKGESVIETRI